MCMCVLGWCEKRLLLSMRDGDRNEGRKGAGKIGDGEGGGRVVALDSKWYEGFGGKSDGRNQVTHIHAYTHTHVDRQLHAFRSSSYPFLKLLSGESWRLYRVFNTVKRFLPLYEIE